MPNDKEKVVVKVVFDGLCCAAPNKKTLNVILVQGEGDQSHHHYPHLLLRTEAVEPGGNPNHVVGLPDGSTYYVWNLEHHEVELSSDGTGDGPVEYADEARPGVSPSANTDIRWIPNIVALSGREFRDDNLDLNKAKPAVVSSVVRLPGGGKLASVLRAKYLVCSFCETISGESHVKDRHAVAEQFTYQLDYDLSAKGKVKPGLSLTLERKQRPEEAEHRGNREGGPSSLRTGKQVIKLKAPSEGNGVLEIMVSNLPLSNSLFSAHFRNFYGLLGNGEYDGPLPDDSARAARPVQCAVARIGQKEEHRPDVSPR